jgi:hypothetical protein
MIQVRCGLFRDIVGGVLLAAVFCSAPPGICSSSDDHQWNNVAQVSHGATYIFVPHDHNCVLGRIKRIDDSGVTVDRRSSPEVTIPRSQLLRITSGGWAPGVVFTARSSWLDVVSVVGERLHPYIAVFTKSGQKHEGKLLRASDRTLTLESSGKTVDIAKGEVSTVSYIRPMPPSDSAAYADDELAWMKVFDPQLWPNMLHLRSALSIRLYDASLSEDDSTIVCNSNPWTQKQPGPDVTTPAYRPKTH